MPVKLSKSDLDKFRADPALLREAGPEVRKYVTEVFQAEAKAKKSQGPPQPSQPARASKRHARLGPGCLSQCVVNYSKLVTNPFCSSSSACLPIPPCMPSRTVSTWVKGTLTTGSGGYGFVTMYPPDMIAGNIPAVNWSSTSAYAGTIITASAAAGSSAASSNSPYDSTAFGTAKDKRQFRLIAAGIRVRYSGTELNRGGSVYGLTHPDHQTLHTYDESTLLAFERMHSSPVTSKKWEEISWLPARPDEYQYGSTVTAGFPTNTNTYMGFLIKRPGTTDVVFDFECFAHFEVIGGGETVVPRMGDMIGGSGLINAFSDGVDYVNSAADRYSNLVSKTVKAIQNMSGFAQLLGPAIGF